MYTVKECIRNSVHRDTALRLHKANIVDYLVWTEVEVPELACLQAVAHVGRLLLAGQGVLPDIDPPAPPHPQQTPLADVTPGGRAGREVGMQGLVGSQVPYLHLPICSCCHHVVTCHVSSHRQDWALHTRSDIGMYESTGSYLNTGCTWFNLSLLVLFWCCFGVVLVLFWCGFGAVWVL